MPVPPFQPGAPSAAGIISWVHLGDLHMTRAGEQNDLDLHAIIDQINRRFASSISFVYLPGDVADQGSADQYRVVREALDKLQAPWCAIVGDHDVHEKSFANFLAFSLRETHFSFTVGQVRFIALNAFDIPEPPSFTMLPEQLDWLAQQLEEVEAAGQKAVLFLHCYPSDLKQGGDRLRKLVRSPAVRLIDMGHTHYNEVANDGQTLYTATRSTGQIEEGPVGFSVTNIDGDVISWHFRPLHQLPAIAITSPADERFITDPTLPGHISEDRIAIRARVWSEIPPGKVTAQLEDHRLELQPIEGSNVWQGELERGSLADGIYQLTVTAGTASDTIRIVVGASAYKAPPRQPRDQDNALAAWPERGLLGTQLGPNKNGRKW
jgi:predicted phosphodiesterase